MLVNVAFLLEVKKLIVQNQFHSDGAKKIISFFQIQQTYKPFCYCIPQQNEHEQNSSLKAKKILSESF